MRLRDKILARHHPLSNPQAGKRYMGGYIAPDAVCAHCSRAWPCPDAQDAFEGEAKERRGRTVT